MVALRRTVLGIHDVLAHTTDQSNLYRYLTAAPEMLTPLSGVAWGSFESTPALLQR